MGMDPSSGFPSTVLALVDRGVPDDGVSYVGALLERALLELAPRSRTITVFPDQEGLADPTLVQRALFALRLNRARRRADCVLSNHVGVATAQSGFLAGREAAEEPFDLQLLRSDSAERRDRATQHVVQAFVSACGFDRQNVVRLINYANL